MKKILVPTDFSEYATAATQVATQLGKKANAEILLLHVVEVPGHASFSATGPSAASSNPSDNVYIVEMVKQAKATMEELVNADEYEGCNLKYHIQVGGPFAVIKEIVENENIDFLVMGTKGATGLEEVLIGSNTEKVVRQSNIPVLTVKHAIDISGIKSILLASSLRDNDLKISPALQAFTAVVPATVKIVRVNTPNNFQSDRLTHQQLASFASKTGLSHVTTHVYNDAIEEDGIIHFAEQEQVDMIAMATHGRTGFIHLLSGSIAEDVVNHAKRPVLTFNIH